MREWQVGDPVGDGNDIGVPDTKYMGYLKDHGENDYCSKDVSKSLKYRQKAWDFKVMHQLLDAESAIDEAIRLNPNDGENWNVKGQILWQNFEEMGYSQDFHTANRAYVCFNRAVEIMPSRKIMKNKKSFLYTYADALYDSNHFKDSADKIDEYLSMIDDETCDEYATGMNFKGCVLKRMGNYEEALECFNKAFEISPDDEIIQSNRKSCIKSGYVGEDVVEDFYSESGNPEEISAYYYERGFNCARTDGQKENAVKYYKKAIEISPDFSLAFEQLGYLLKDLGRYREAIKYLKRVPVDSDDCFATWNIADCHVKLNECKRAIPYLNICIESNPLRDDWVEDKFKCLLKLDRIEEAVLLYDWYFDLMIEDGRENKARKCINEILKLRPDDSHYLNKRNSLSSSFEIISDSSKSTSDEYGNASMDESYADNPLDLIKQAKELLDDGAITQDEYDVLKKKYLDMV